MTVQEPGGSGGPLDEVALDYLRGFLKSNPEGRQAAAGVSAASALLQHHRWMVEWDDSHRPERQLVDMLAKLLGGTEAMQRWLSVPANLESLRRSLPTLKREAQSSIVGPEELSQALAIMREAGEE